MTRYIGLIAVLLLSACGSDEVTVSERPGVSYATIQPAAGITYQEFRKTHEWGAGDLQAAQKRFILLDRNNDGHLSDEELGGL